MVVGSVLILSLLLGNVGWIGVHTTLVVSTTLGTEPSAVDVRLGWKSQ